MKNPPADVNDGIYTPLVSLDAVAVVLEALIDRQDGTVLFHCRAIDPLTGHLLAAWSSTPRRYDSEYIGAAEALGEFKIELLKHTGPF
jgi:hypothetical protein